MADGKSCTDQLDQAYTVTLIRGTCGIDAIENQGSWRATTQGSSRSLTCLSAAGILINYIMAIESQHQPENVGESVSCITEDEDVPAVSAGTAAKKDLRSHFYLRAASRNPGSSSANRSIVRGGTGQTTRAARRTAPEQVSNPQPPISRPCALITALSRQCHRPYGARCRLAVGAARAAAGSGWFDSEGPSGSQRSVSCRHRTASQKRCRLIHSPKCRPSPVSR